MPKRSRPFNPSNPSTAALLLRVPDRARHHRIRDRLIRAQSEFFQQRLDRAGEFLQQLVFERQVKCKVRVRPERVGEADDRVIRGAGFASALDENVDADVRARFQVERGSAPLSAIATAPVRDRLRRKPSLAKMSAQRTG